MTEADAFYIDRPTQKLLLALLRRIPTLAEDLAVSEMKQARTTRPDVTRFRKRRKLKSSLPLNEDVFTKAEALRNEIFGWIRLVCEQRSRNVPVACNLIEAARWLEHNVIPLAMTEGADGAYSGIFALVKDCERIVDLPPDDHVNVDLEKVESANRKVMTSGQVEKIADRLGDVGKGLNRMRIRNLEKSGEIEAIAVDQETGTRFFRLGDVIQAHQRRPRRNRRPA